MTLQHKKDISIATKKGMTLEVRKKLSKSLTGRKLSKEHLKNRIEAQSGKNHWNWQDGKSFEPYPLGWTNTFKEQIRYRDGYKCQVCGCPEVENGRKLDVHHKDYNKNNLDSKNLVSLCKSCHMRTNFNREKWIEYFQIKQEELICQKD